MSRSLPLSPMYMGHTTRWYHPIDIYIHVYIYTHIASLCEQEGFAETFWRCYCYVLQYVVAVCWREMARSRVMCVYPPGVARRIMSCSLPLPLRLFSSRYLSLSLSLFFGDSCQYRVTCAFTLVSRFHECHTIHIYLRGVSHFEHKRLSRSGVCCTEALQHTATHRNTPQHTATHMQQTTALQG